MAQRTEHGGSCCGRYHIYGFTGRETVADIQALVRPQGNRIAEVCLAEYQFDNSEQTVLDAGFVKVAEWENSNSGNDVRMYLYCPNWQAFPDGAPARQVTVQGPERRVEVPAAPPRQLFTVGQRVRNRVSGGFGRIRTLEGRANHYGSRDHIYVTREATNDGYDWARENLEAVAEPVVVFSTYHNVLRTGRSEAGWPTIEDARAAAPRARSIDRRNIYSDGSVTYENAE